MTLTSTCPNAEGIRQQLKMFYLCNILDILITRQSFETSLQTKRETMFYSSVCFLLCTLQHNEHQPAAAPHFIPLDAVGS